MGWPDSLPLNAALDRNAIIDGRARFREVLDAVNQAHGPALPDYRKTNQILRTLDGEGAATGKAVDLGPIPPHVHVVVLPGFLEQCVARLATVLAQAMAHVESLGAKTSMVALEGRAGAARNAKTLRDFLLTLPQGDRVVIVAMSKGMVDTLEMLALYPQTHARVQAVVSLVGAVWGSPLAHMTPKWLKWIERNVPFPTCKAYGGEAVLSLTPEVRSHFFANNSLPTNVRQYALCAAVEAENMSQGMMAAFLALQRIGGLNDGQMLLADQIAPGAEVLGVLNGDHIAVGMAFNRNPGIIARWICKRGLDKNAFPREIMLEAVVRRVLEDL